MSYMLSHLENGYQVDQAILSEEDRVVVSFNSFLTYHFVDGPTYVNVEPIMTEYSKLEFSRFRK